MVLNSQFAGQNVFIFIFRLQMFMHSTTQLRRLNVKWLVDSAIPQIQIQIDWMKISSKVMPFRKCEYQTMVRIMIGSSRCINPAAQPHFDYLLSSKPKNAKLTIRTGQIFTWNMCAAKCSDAILNFYWWINKIVADLSEFSGFCCYHSGRIAIKREATLFSRVDTRCGAQHNFRCKWTISLEKMQRPFDEYAILNNS